LNFDLFIYFFAALNGGSSSNEFVEAMKVWMSLLLIIFILLQLYTVIFWKKLWFNVILNVLIKLLIWLSIYNFWVFVLILSITQFWFSHFASIIDCYFL
jgi:hypothetical protein